MYRFAAGEEVSLSPGQSHKARCVGNHPERTLLHQTVAEHYETWLELASAGQFDGQGDHHSPKPCVRNAFEKYLECGIFARGFATAAHLSDHVFPRLPVRQWVLSVPKQLRYFMQRDGAVLGMAQETELQLNLAAPDLPRLLSRLQSKEIQAADEAEGLIRKQSPKGHRDPHRNTHGSADCECWWPPAREFQGQTGVSTPKRGLPLHQ